MDINNRSINSSANIYFCLGLTEMYRSSAVHNNLFRDRNAVYIYSDYVIGLQKDVEESLKHNYDFYIVRYVYDRNGRIKKCYGWAKHAKQIKNIMKSISSKYHKVTLFTFHDNWVFTPTIIEDFKKIKNNNGINLLEDGCVSANQLYKHVSVRHLMIKKIIYRCLGLSPHCIKNGGIGWNRNISTIYSPTPEKVAKSGRARYVEIKYEGDVFSSENLSQFISNLGLDMLQQEYIKKFDFLFLTQPLEEETKRELYIKALKDVFSCFQGSKKCVLVKKHPRDHMDYTQFMNENISICGDEVGVLPVEVLINFINNTKILTFSSSACLNISKYCDCIFLYKIILDERYIKAAERLVKGYKNITVLETLDDLRIMTEANND